MPTRSKDMDMEEFPLVELMTYPRRIDFPLRPTYKRNILLDPVNYCGEALDRLSPHASYLRAEYNIISEESLVHVKYLVMKSNADLRYRMSLCIFTDERKDPKNTHRNNTLIPLNAIPAEPVNVKESVYKRHGEQPRVFVQIRQGIEPLYMFNGFSGSCAPKNEWVRRII